MADDWAWPYAGAYGDSLVITRGFDRIAREGILFTHAFCPAPSCTPSRLSILTGQYPHRLNEGANHMVKFPKSYDVYPEMLEKAGYYVGKFRKGASFGSMAGSEWEHDPAGRDFKNFAEFLDQNFHGQPFCFWYGSQYPHRPFPMHQLRASDSLAVPGYLPNVSEVRLDLVNYFEEIRKFDIELSVILHVLEARDLLDNTIIIVTSDNGIPFPRGKGTCYDSGTRVPLAIMWPERITGGRICDDFVNLSDLAPTILEAAGLTPTKDMTGVSLFDVLADSMQSPSPAAKSQKPIADSKRRRADKIRDAVFVERERHALGRGGAADTVGTLSYPIRGIRTKEYLYVVNLRPYLWPACDPPLFNDIDSSPSKTCVLKFQAVPDSSRRFFELAAGKRPREELYDVRKDPYQLNNLAYDDGYREVKQELWTRLHRWMVDTEDPRAEGEDNRWDTYMWNPIPKTANSGF